MHSTLEAAQTAKVAPWTEYRDDLSTGLCAVFADKFPVTKGHLLFVPRMNYPEIITECFKNALDYGNRLVATGQCDAYNIGINQGVAAGQTVMYPHVHLIPRYINDCEDPVGGVRSVIPGQANYHKNTYKEPV